MAPRLTYAEYLTTLLFIAVVARLKHDDAETANAEPRLASAAFENSDAEPGMRWGAVAEPASNARIEPTMRRSSCCCSPRPDAYCSSPAQT